MKVRDLLADPANWTKGAFAIDGDGCLVTAAHPRACRFCLRGAVSRCYPDWDEQMAAVRKLSEAVYGYGKGGRYDIAGFNDHPETTHADILAVLDLAGV